MGIKVGGVDLFSQGLSNEYRIIVLEKIVEKIVSKNTNINLITTEEVEEVKKQSLVLLQNKYPEAGITEGKNNE